MESPSTDAGRRQGEQKFRRRLLLRGAGATILAGGLSGCLARDIEREATRVGIPPEKAKEAGYDPSPRVETITSEYEETAGPVSVDAEVTSYLVQYEYLSGEDTQSRVANGNYGGYGDDGLVGLFNVFSTPKGSIFGRSFNPVARRSYNELPQRRPGLFERLGSFDLDNQITVKRVDDPTTTKVDDDTDVYITSGISVGKGVSVSVLGTDVRKDDLGAVFIPDFENEKAHYAIGTKVETDDDSVFGSYVGHTKTGPSRVFELVSQDEEKGLFTREQLKEFDRRFLDAAVLLETIPDSSI